MLQMHALELQEFIRLKRE
jgi:hypothetical protein